MKKIPAKKNNSKASKPVSKPKKPAAAPKKPAAVKKPSPKPAAKPAAKSAPKPAAKKLPAKKPAVKKEIPAENKCKTNPNKPCCGKKDCDCKAKAEKHVAEIFGQLSQVKAVENLLKDYFYTELLKRDVEEDVANSLANNLTITVDTFEANIDIK